MQDGLYKVDFSSPLGHGSGVIVINGDSFYGGDGAIAYAGSIQSTGSNYTAQLRIMRHSQGAMSVLGVDQGSITLNGHAPNDQEATLTASLPGGVGQFRAHLQKLPL